MRTKIILLVISLFLFTYQRAYTMQIAGGRVIDVVVADSGYTDSTFVTEFFENWLPVGPAAFDIDENGNIYVLDIAERVLKFDKEGKWITTFKGISKSGEPEGQYLQDMAVDNRKNIYVAKSARIMKFSPQGKFLLQTEDIPKNDRGEPSRSIGPPIAVDKAGRIYDPFSDDGIAIYDEELKLKQVVHTEGWRYGDFGIVQKEVGNNVYFRQNKYLFRTSLEEYTRGGKIDTLAILPEEIVNPNFVMERPPEEYRSPGPFCPFIGFDKDNCFYFHKAESWGDKEKSENTCKTYTILRYRLKGGRLTKTGEIRMSFEKDKTECSNISLLSGGLGLSLRVNSDGTIYWLHGTVDTVKVSKIIFDE